MTLERHSGATASGATATASSGTVAGPIAGDGRELKTVAAVGPGGGLVRGIYLMARRADTVERAIADPRSIYASPEQVLKDRRFGIAEKRAVLESWERSARERDADRAGPEGEASMHERILAALARLEEETAGPATGSPAGDAAGVPEAGEER